MRIMSVAKRWLYIAHRWTGIVVCLFMALWFVSGVVMMYVGYPKLTPLERLARLPQLSLADACCISPQQALQAAREALPEMHAGHEPAGRTKGADTLPELKLAMLGDTPYWLVSDGRNRQTSIKAATGEAIAQFDAAHALSMAKTFAPASHPSLMEVVRQDIFTVSRGLDHHRPLFRIALNDVDGTELYVSSRTGEVIRDSTRLERGWNYLGSILHFFYPLKGELFDKWRSDIIIYTSLVGTVLALLGVWVGVLRWRFKGRFASGSRSPYRNPWMRWHHISGLIFGVVTLTWVLSGMLSLNPWKIFESAAPKLNQRAFAGVGLDRARFVLSPREAIARAGFPVREIGVRLFDGHAYYLLRAANGHTGLIAAEDASATTKPMDMMPEAALLAAAAKLIPEHEIVRVTRLTDYDNYYYGRQPHNMSGHIERRLPALRVEYDDPGHTWVHLDPYTANVFNRLDDTSRLRRWLFNFLHSFDLRGFVDSRPLWDVTLILLSIGGFVLCGSGVVIGWRRLRRPAPAPATQ
ncbi:MAG: PepSY domain-containing protein [Sulfuritalea sp.]|nr:PepSY domain-containing protein [Sulfuritalea sp.]